MLRYALTIFLSAFLLFQVQPLISKIILPWFGGTPAVWTTCMVFFQVALLGGYAYAHLVATKLRQRQQVAVHLAVLAVAVALLPIMPGAGWKPQRPEDPTWRILVLLAACVGLPYFALSTTSPLLQAWFSRTHPGRSPYRLYALSNVGSLLALLSFPFVLEPALSVRTQASAWGWSFAAVAAAAAWCALRTWHVAAEPSAAAESPSEPAPAPGLARRLLWLGLPAVASVMLLAVTNQICQDIAVVPFLWVLPLSLYLLSFIICFDRERWYFRPLFWAWMAGSMAVMVWLLQRGVRTPIQTQVLGYSLGLFGCCMVCHGELVRLKPGPRHLTAFYLMVATGGALGGVFVSLIAPLIFSAYLELHYGLMAACILAMAAFWLDRRPHRHWPRSVLSRVGVTAYLTMPAVGAIFGKPAGHQVLGIPASRDVLLSGWVFAGVLMLGIWVIGARVRRVKWSWAWLLVLPAFLSGLLFLGSELVAHARLLVSGKVWVSRNFYGVLRVMEYYRSNPDRHQYLLSHGMIDHGCQLLSLEGRRRPITYFSERSGLGIALRRLAAERPSLRVAVIGLGAGTIAAYGRKGDHYRFYEINPTVRVLATTLFTYLADSPADVQVAMGDARLSLEREDSQGFDLLVIDAFSGDAIPAHLLTREAFDVYLHHLRPDGAIAVHITNRYLDLKPVVRALADRFAMRRAFVVSAGDDERDIYLCTWAILSRNERFMDSEAIQSAASAKADASQRAILWTDDYSDLFRILK